MGALIILRVGDLEKIDNMYKVRVYSGEKEEYITFTTPECTKEIDTYLDFRNRHGEIITDDSVLFVKKFDVNRGLIKGEQLSDDGIRLLDEIIRNTGLRQANHTNQFKRQTVPMLHGFRRHFTKQLIDSKLNPEIREMLLGHKIGLASCYYKPSEQEMLNEYFKAVPLLTISDEERVKYKLQEHIKIEKSRVDRLEESLKRLEKKYNKKG